MSMGPHIVSAFDSDLQDIFARVCAFGELTRQSLDKSLSAVASGDVVLADEIVRNDQELDRIEAEIEQIIVRTIALRQPMAQDLRELIASIKLCSVFERIGDHTKSIAKRVLLFSKNDTEHLISEVCEMGTIVSQQLAEGLQAYKERDKCRALPVWKNDIDIDEKYNDLLRLLMVLMAGNPSFVETATHIIFVVKNLERIGDHATFLAEMVYYVVEGDVIGDQRPKGTVFDASSCRNGD